ncbi:hypothetical protein WICMUC_001430 [Wickerhamomyces mucosus]|uniref:Kinetochore protein Spc24 n=1 Tax=Wickerhamomyces mucosus TaxID=1378264 RepID=A0A9P8PU56_9ASCO|nr:hypothetical protein WICMUC_001430 [Wickerhamomyces mucosus]
MSSYPEQSEDLLALLRDTLDGFSIQTDLDALDRISHNLKQLQTNRQTNIKNIQDDLKNLSNQLLTKKNLIDSIIEGETLEDRNAKREEKFKQELELNKNLKEINSTKQELSTNLNELLDEINDLNESYKTISNNSYIEQEDEENQVIILKLSVYKSFGISFDFKNNLIIIFNKKKNLSDFLKLDEEKFSDYFITNYIWDRI